MSDQLVDDLLAGGVEPRTHRLLTAAAGGDPVLLRVLVLAGLGLGELVRHDGRWCWNSSAPPALRPAGAQLAALRTLSGAWTEPYPTSATDPVAQPAVDLTERQREILVLLGDGLTVQAIARRLSLSPRTVAKHQERMYRKLGTSDRLTTVLQAQRRGLLRPAGSDS